MEDFNTKFATFLAGVNNIVAAGYQNSSDGYPFNVSVEARRGKRYIKLVRVEAHKDGTPTNGGLGSAYAFVDTTNGNVLKAASWSTPAKHARGNIFDDSNGLALIGPYGPAYLR